MALTTEFHIIDKVAGGLAVKTSFPSEAAAQTAAQALVIADGGPPLLHIFGLVSTVGRATETIEVGA